MKNIDFSAYLPRGIFKAASRLAAVVSPFLVDSRKVERIVDLAYGTYGNFLDIFIPRQKIKKELPITILIHGGGFRLFSKESHATAASMSAQNGQLTFNIDYRLTPENPYPAGLVDTIEAYHWVLANAEKYGGNLNQISIIGESSGANYALSLCLYLFGLGAVPKNINLPPKPTTYPKNAVIHCGFLQVTDPKRLSKDPRCSSVARTSMIQIQKNYLPESVGRDDEDFGLANPLIIIESLSSSGAKLPAGFPEIFVPVGEADPVIADSERLGIALERLGQKNKLKIYPGEGHAFYAFIHRNAAKIIWRDINQAIQKKQPSK